MSRDSERRDDQPLSKEEVAAIEGHAIGRVEFDPDQPRTRTISLRLNDDEFSLFTTVARAAGEGLSTSIKRLAEESALLEVEEDGHVRRVAFDIIPAALADAVEFSEAQGVELKSVFVAALADYVARHRVEPEPERVAP